MWKTLKYNNVLYIFKVTFSENTFEASLSNLKVIWKEEDTLSTILKRFGTSNPILDCDTEYGLKEEIMAMIDNIGEGTDIQIEEDKSLINLTVTSQRNKININFKFLLAKQSEEVFFSDITCSLIKTIRYLDKSQLMLTTLLEKKDRELVEYHLEKGEITRDDLVTKPFDKNSINYTKGPELLNIFSDVLWTEFCITDDKVIGDSVEVINELSSKPNPVKRRIYSAKLSNKKKHYLSQGQADV